MHSTYYQDLKTVKYFYDKKNVYPSSFYLNPVKYIFIITMRLHELCFQVITNLVKRHFAGRRSGLGSWTYCKLQVLKGKNRLLQYPTKT